ncbi:MAG: hypothetical protein KBT39_03490 [Bacteroidales bacterium]|nr:hypothetical protein [Bacteroidales bacterium]
MKKITLLLLALISSVVGMAQSVKITSLSEEPTTAPQGDKVYAIMCNSQHSTTTWMYDGGAKPLATNDGVALDEVVATSYLWKITPTGEEGVYTFQNVSTEKYISIDGTGNGGAVSMSAEQKTVIITVGEGGYVALKSMTANQWIDMGYNGFGVETWSDGVSGSRRMMIFEVGYEGVGESEIAMSNLNKVFAYYNANHNPNDAQNNVGTDPGNYGQDAVSAYFQKMEYAAAVIDADGADLSIEEINQIAADIETLWEAVVASSVPYAQAIKPGYYVIKNALDFYTETTTEPSEDPATGETIPGETIREHHEKAIYADKTALKWKTFEEKADFLFKIEETETPLSYTVTNQLTGQAFKNTTTLGEPAVGMSFDLSKKSVEIWEGGKVVAPVYNIRLTQNRVRDYDYVHAGGHNAGKGVSGNIVNWNHEDESVNASDWYLEEIDEATAQAWIEASSPGKVVAAMIDSINTIKGAFPGQKTIAEDTKPFSLVNAYSPCDHNTLNSGKDGQGLPALLDNNFSTFWHSAWGNVPQYNHYFVVEAAEPLDGEFTLLMARRSNANSDKFTKLNVYGSNDFDGENYEDATWAELGTCTYEDMTQGKMLEPAEKLNTNGVGYKFFKVELNEKVTSSGNFFWHAAEVQIVPSNGVTNAKITQAQARAKEIAAVEAAIEAWNAAGYTTANVADPNDAAFVAAYNAVVEAYAAWTKVYSDPAEMRDLMAQIAEFRKGLVEGNNPGQWSASQLKRAQGNFDNVLELVSDYINCGAYTPAETASCVQSLKSELTTVSTSFANPVQEGKWYVLRFATEEEYEANDWDKAGAVSAAEGDLYGCLVAPASIEAGEPKTHPTVAIEEIRKGQPMRFTALAEKSDAAIRFVKVDGGYFIQHVSGWYVGANGQLTNTPALFSTRAIGYGKSLIKTRNLDGTDYNNGGTPSYLHAQVAGHLLVSWAADAIDSRSALYIEEIDAQTIEPYVAEDVVTGTVKFMTSPVEVTYSPKSDVTLYTFDGYEKTDNGIKVAFSETQKAEAGKAVLMVVLGDYPEAAPTDEDKTTLELQLGKAYAAVPDSTQALVGTYKYQWVEAADTLHMVTIFQNKMQMANGADNTDCARDISAYTGAINLLNAAEISTAGKDLVIEIVGEADPTAIKEVLAKAVNANGKIYTIDGKYVGNGNIAAARKFGAGLYIINGVKVAIK